MSPKSIQNAFFASMTDPQEIEAMCRDYAKQHYPDLFDL